MDQAVRFESSITKKYATKWMSFTAFKYADNNEKIAFRKIERLKNKMLPTYTNVNLHDGAARNEEFVLEFRLNLIKRQIEKNIR